MTFNSIEFLIFFLLFLPLYFSTPGNLKWFILLGVGYLFYGYWHPINLLFLILPTVAVYILTLKMAAANKQRQKKQIMVTGLISGLALLLVFKYTDFVGSTLHPLLGMFRKTPTPYNPINLLLPIGISFYSFKLVSYVIDVYQNKLEPERHFGYFALYVSFFPQILAGPIDRAVNLLPELKKKVTIDYERISRGIRLMLWGFFKKIVIADHLALATNLVYSDVHNYQGIPLLTAVLFYSVQIYCDFSGYSDIAIGIAEILGFKSMDNFDTPYFSKDIKQFWSKWHISLSTWLRDYLFLPIAYATMRRIPSSTLMKVKAETWGYVVGMLITMFLGGLWHGAGWTFVLWGVFHGLYLALSHATKKIRKKIVKTTGLNKIPLLHHWIRIAVTFSMVTLAWIFFRAQTIPDAFYVVTHLFKGIGSQIAVSGVTGIVKQTIQFNEVDLAIIALSILLLCIVDFLQNKKSVAERFAKASPWLHWSLYCLLIYVILWFGEFNITEFIYFQF